MLREIGFFIVLLCPVVLVYLSGGLNKPQATNSGKKKKKSKKNKNKSQAVTPESDNKQNDENQQEKAQVVQEVQEVQKEEAKPMTKTALRKLKQEKKKADKEALEAMKEEQKDEEKEEKVREIDQHMDTTTHYARVMRIQTEDDEEWETVPYEEGWSQVKARRAVPSSNTGSPVVGSSAFNSPSQMNSRLDRTAVKNAKKAQKRKEEKAANDALQAERLRKHQKQLEKAKIDEFYSTGAGKNTPWGKKGSSKRPQATASVNEHGSLIWD